MSDVVTATQIAARFKVHRQTVYQWIAREGFPRPVGEIAGARVWRLGEVLAWRERTDLSPGRPRKR